MHTPMSENHVKITEIKEYYTVKRKERNAAGELVEVEKNMFRYKEVNFVTGWARFGHYLLDRVFFTIAELLFGGVLGVFLGLTGNVDWMDHGGDTIVTIFGYVVLYPCYYLILEYTTQASLAKLILGRVVVNEYGEKPSFNQILGRSYARIVPFEAFSCLATTGWHDNWSNTYVIRKQDLDDLKTLARLQEHLAK
jgi:uncharacterized RDD family membrane protein YckC